MLHIAICDDEEVFVLRLQSLIQKYMEETGHAFRISVYSDGQELLLHYPMDIDLIFLDIQMPHINGLEAAKSIRKMDPKVALIFLTSMTMYALEGYKYNATNFIIKPIQYVRLKDELDRWLLLSQQKESDYILVTNDTGKYKVFLNNLQYIETFGRNLMLHTDTENILSYKKLKNFESELPASSFIRCHSSYIINLLFVKKVEKLEIEFTTGACIPISQPKRKKVMEKLAEYWGNRL